MAALLARMILPMMTLLLATTVLTAWMVFLASVVLPILSVAYL